MSALLKTLPLATITSIYNEAVETFDTGFKPVVKFKTKEDALQRIIKVMEKRGLVVMQREGQLPILVVPAAEESETSVDEAVQELTMTDDEKQAAAAAEKQQAQADKAAEKVAEKEAKKAQKQAERDAKAAQKKADAEAAKAAKQAARDAKKAEAEAKVRTIKVDRKPRKANEIAACRAGSNQAILVDCLFAGTTMEFATKKINEQRKADGKAVELTMPVTYGTMLYDLVQLKGYGVRGEYLNGEGLWNLCLFDDASSLKWPLADRHPDDVPYPEVEAARTAEGYDAKPVKAVYFLVLPEGMDEPVPHVTRKVVEVVDKKASKGKDPAKSEAEMEKIRLQIEADAKAKEEEHLAAQRAADGAEFEVEVSEA